MYLERTVKFNELEKEYELMKSFGVRIPSDTKKDARRMEIWHSSFQDKGKDFTEFIFLDSQYLTIKTIKQEG